MYMCRKLILFSTAVTIVCVSLSTYLHMYILSDATKIQMLKWHLQMEQI